MKRTSMLLMAFALVLTMTHCNKNEETKPNETVTIMLNVKGNNGAKVVVDPAAGTVNFESGDKVYVGSGGRFVGTLTHNGINFVGNITNPTEGQPLQFYFLGNVTPAETLTAGTTEECSVVIGDQTQHLPIISCAPSYENYVSGITEYTGHLLNKCALVKFSVTSPSNSPICITGMKNKVTIDFTQNTVTPGIDGDGIIKLPAGDGENVEKWAILLPQDLLDEGEEGSVYSEDGSYTGTRPAIPSISENGYLSEGIVVTVNTESNNPIANCPTGAINGLFSIDANRQVYFSQGNLQYRASTNIWQFAANQYDYIGNANSNISQNYDGWIDLFGWATSGWNNGNLYYHPYDSYYDNYYITNNGYGYGPTDGSNYLFDLTDLYANADWGVFNPISNGGNDANMWRTLTNTEWNYMLFSRSTPSGMRYAKARVCGINGLILLPDDWNTSIFSLTNCNNVNASFGSNIIASSQWPSLQNAGAVFLVTAGYRWGTNVGSCGTVGRYWSASLYSYTESNNAIGITFQENGSVSVGGFNRSLGLSVRLVQDYNP